MKNRVTRGLMLWISVVVAAALATTMSASATAAPRERDSGADVHTGNASSFDVRSASAPARDASFEPRTWRMWCRDSSGNTYYVSSPTGCRRGYIKFISTYNGKVEGGLDMYALEMRVKRSVTLTQAVNECKANLLCNIAVLVVEGYAVSKLTIAYKWLRSLFSVSAAQPGRSGNPISEEVLRGA